MAKLPYRDRVKFWAIQITDGHCAYCGKLITSFAELQLDHAYPTKPHSHCYHDSLILPSCPKCNNQKKDRTIEGYRNYLKIKLNVDEFVFYLDKCRLLKFISPNVNCSGKRE